jgi:hypothetical protein
MMTGHHPTPIAPLIKSSRKSIVHREWIDRLMATFVNMNVYTGVPSRLFSTKSAAPSRSKDIKDYWKLMRQELMDEEYKAAKNEHRRNKRHENNKRRGKNARLPNVDAITVIPPGISSPNNVGTFPSTCRKIHFG